MGRVVLGLAVGCAVVACGIAAVAVGRRVRSRRSWTRAVAVVTDLEEGCATPYSRLRQVVDAMAVEMHAGLASDGGSKLKMLLTFVDALPDGNETGTFYALDLGAATFRVLKVQLGGKQSRILWRQVEQHTIPPALVSSTTEDLFDFLAMTLKNFVERNNDGFEQSDKRKELGVTFPFPVRQLSVSSGILIKWTKGFAIRDTVGKDVTQCLQEALTKRGLDMQVAALVNDTVGTLALGHYYDEDTVAAVIIGTGTNACYIERTDAIIKCQGLLTNSGGMVINMEWGSFWSSHLPRTPYDFALDDETLNRNDQGFEKMISGMYLGDIVRRVLLRIALESDVLGNSAHSLSIPFVLGTPLMAAMREDDTPDLEEVGKILEENLQMHDTSLKARRLVVRVCDVVTQRAARLGAAGIVGILKKIGRDGSGGVASGRARGKPKRTVVAVEGGLYAGYSTFREYLNEAVVEILGAEVARNVVLRVFEDGSGIGAALLAASLSSEQ
ncbi:Hexokinase protein [Dioscorea alata]|uniref:Hexokinase protein n=1 Tax=Dioscorea alata TaxID=55571 RepID=A0ACB7V228_DIOAL|nr:Hexokinase protein [Dioscorea alata]